MLAEEFGCKPEDLMAIPEVVFCRKCEESFELEGDEEPEEEL